MDCGLVIVQTPPTHLFLAIPPLGAIYEISDRCHAPVWFTVVLYIRSRPCVPSANITFLQVRVPFYEWHRSEYTENGKL